MRLTVAGSAASYAAAGEACSGYLVEHDGTTIMLDCGNGALSAASSYTDPARLAGIVVTHEHADHFLDLFALQALLRYAPEGAIAGVALHGPAGLFARMQRLLDERGAAELAEAFAFTPLAAGETLAFGPLAVTPLPVDHIPDTFALRVEAGGRTLVYTSDTAYGPAALAAAAGADVLLAECTLPTRYAGRVPHLSPGETGRLASEAGAGVLVLTHLWPTADRDELLAHAAAAFDGPIHLAHTGLVLDI